MTQNHFSTHQSTEKLYLQNLMTLRGETKVVEILPIESDKKIIRTETTYFHPQGGGQKADRGKIGTANVIAVKHNGGFVDHYVDDIEFFEVGSTYNFEIDRDWRTLNSSYHTAGHLLASVVENIYNQLTAVSGHQWPGEAKVEFTINYEKNESNASFDSNEINKKLAETLSSKPEVLIQGNPYSNRSIKIGNFKAIPCGGTHILNLKEINSVVVRSIQKKGDKLIIKYEVGH